jgi:HlyD family secretion protein
MKLYKKFVPIVLIVAIAIVLLLWFRSSKIGNKNTIVLSGNIELTEVNIAFKIPGKLVELTVDEGARVKKGMIIARLDQEQLLHQRDRSRAALAAAESQLTQLHISIQYQKETYQGQTEQRQAELRQAEARLRELLAGTRSQEIEQAQAAVYRARTEHDLAKRDWERAQILYTKEAIATSQYDQFKARYESAQATLSQAEEQLSLLVEGPRKEDIEAAHEQVARARAGVRLAKALRLDIRSKEQELETVRAEIKRARAELAVIESQLEDTVAMSPVDGVVLVKATELGEVVAAGTTVVTVGDIDHPWLRGYIIEQDLGRVKLGGKVKVTTDSFPGKIYWGRVSFISSEAEFTPKQIQMPEERVKLVYRIKIDIENPLYELKANMPADAEILLNEDT